MEKQIVKLNRRVLNKTKEVEISQDVIVPDVKPDIAQITTTNGNAYLYKEEVGNRKNSLGRKYR